MTKASPRSEAIAHLKAALATGVRGATREALLASLDALTEADDRGGEITDLHVRRLKPRTRLFDPRRPGFTTHAMRRAMATWIAEHGASKEVRDRLLAHVDRASVDARHSRAALDRPAAEWWAKWADFLVGLQVENVVRLDQVDGA